MILNLRPWQSRAVCYAMRISALETVLAGICTVKVVVVVLSEPKSKTAIALLLLLAL
jgi:hypothetical protein